MEWNNGDLSELITSGVGKVYILKNYGTYLKVKWYFPSKARELRHNNITLEDWEDFMRDPDRKIHL